MRRPGRVHGLGFVVDRARVVRALLDVGRQDIDVEGLVPLDPHLRVLGASSDYLVLDVTDAGEAVQVGDRLRFSMSYRSLLAAMTSEYVDKRLCDANAEDPHDG